MPATVGHPAVTGSSCSSTFPSLEPTTMCLLHMLHWQSISRCRNSSGYLISSSVLLSGSCSGLSVRYRGSLNFCSQKPPHSITQSAWQVPWTPHMTTRSKDKLCDKTHAFHAHYSQLLPATMLCPYKGQPRCTGRCLLCPVQTKHYGCRSENIEAILIE